MKAKNHPDKNEGGNQGRKARSTATARGTARAPEVGDAPSAGDLGAREIAPGDSGPKLRLSGRQALAVWELILQGDGKPASKRKVKLRASETKELQDARWITIASGRRKKDPNWGAKLYLTDRAWEWANREGLSAALSLSKVAAPLFAGFLRRVREYLETHDLPLDHLLRPRRPAAEPSPPAPAAREEPTHGAPSGASRTPLEERIRAAYAKVTDGALNQFVRLALLRAELDGEERRAVDEELRAMEERGDAILYPFDHPRRSRPEDNVAALRVGGDRRDLFCIKW